MMHYDLLKTPKIQDDSTKMYLFKSQNSECEFFHWNRRVQ